MKTQLSHYRISLVCRLLNVSRSGYYAWLNWPVKSTALDEHINKQYWYHKARLGAPSLVHDARDKGYHVSERTISRVLQHLGLRSKAARKFKYKTDSGSGHNVVLNKLNREFNPDKPNIVWVSDIMILAKKVDRSLLYNINKNHRRKHYG